MIRLTKGKALIGSLDVQGDLTVNGAPVGAGGGDGGVGPELVYQMYVDPQGVNGDEQWSVGMQTRYIIMNNNNDSGRMNWQQNFVTENNVQIGEKFIVTKAEYWGYGGALGYTWLPCDTSIDWSGYNFYAVGNYDYMNNVPTLNVGNYGNASWGMQAPFRFTFKRKG